MLYHCMNLSTPPAMANVLHLTCWYPPGDSKVAGNSGTSSIGLPGFLPIGPVGSDYIIGNRFLYWCGSQSRVIWLFPWWLGVVMCYLHPSTQSHWVVGRGRCHIIRLFRFGLQFFDLHRVLLNKKGPHRSSGGPKIFQVFFQVPLVHLRTATGT